MSVCVGTVDVFAWWGGGNVGPDSADLFTDTCDRYGLGLELCTSATSRHVLNVPSFHERCLC